VLVDFLNNKIINQKALGQTCTKTILFISFMLQNNNFEPVCTVHVRV